MNIYILKGLPGVGKSTVAKELARELNALLINKDDINDVVFSHFGANKESSITVYELIRYILKTINNNVKDVVVDCSLSRKKNYEDFLEVAKETKSNLKVIEVFLSDYNKVEKRFQSRTDLPEHRIKSISDIEKQGLEYDAYEIEGLIRVDNSNTMNDTILDLKNKLSL